MKEKLKWVYRKEILADIPYFLLAGAVGIFTLLRLPSLVEPDWYGDEGIYQVIGRALNSGRLLYRDIWDNKPPVLYIYYAFVNGDLFLIRLLSLIFGAAAIVVFFFIARSLFQKKNLPVYFSTFTLAILFGLPLIEGNIANAENFMLFPTLLALFFVLKLKAASRPIVPLLIGLLLSISFLTKIVALFDLSAFLVILFIIRFYNKSLLDVKKHFLSDPLEFLKVLKQEGMVLIGFVVPIVITVIYFTFAGALGDFTKAAFSQNVGYVGYGNYFIIPQGLLILKLILLGFSILLILRFRRKLGIASIVVYTWIAFSLFSAFFSGRPYTHYVLVFLPAFCLLLGLMFSSRKYALFNIALVIFFIAFMRTQFHYYTKITAYYLNYRDYIMGEKSAESYQAFFDANTPRNYEIARYITENTTKKDSVFLLSDSSTIYYLADKLPPGRYIVEYHISFYKDGVLETQKALQKAKPKFIIVTKDQLLPDFINGFTKKYLVSGVQIYER